MMMTIKGADGLFEAHSFATERAFEAVVVQLADELFGPRTVYLPARARIADAATGIAGVPDGYLLDLTAPERPRLRLVEVELARHDPLRHIGAQILRFAAAYRGGTLALKRALSGRLDAEPTLAARAARLGSEAGFTTLDAMLEAVLAAREAQSVVVIDEASTALAQIIKHIVPTPEILEVRAFVPRGGQDLRRALFQYTPLHRADACTQTAPAAPDTLVVPVQGAVLQSVFLGERRWYAVPLPAGAHESIQFIAACIVSPQEAVTHIAPVREIRPYRATSRWEILLAEPATPLGPLPLPPATRGMPFPRLISRRELLS
jgi:hypothetical protein